MNENEHPEPDEADWPEPRQDPDEEPAEPWARHGAPPWVILLERLEEMKRAADPEADPEP